MTNLEQKSESSACAAVCAAAMSSQTVSFPAADALVENDGGGDSPSPAAPERTSSEKASSSGKAPRPYPLARVNSTPVSLPQYRGARAMHDDGTRDISA